jgi:hypothetical protein
MVTHSCISFIGGGGGGSSGSGSGSSSCCGMSSERRQLTSGGRDLVDLPRCRAI